MKCFYCGFDGHAAKECRAMFNEAQEYNAEVPSAETRREAKKELWCRLCCEKKRNTGQQFPGWGKHTEQRCFFTPDGGGPSPCKEDRRYASKSEDEKKKKEERKDEKTEEGKKQKKDKDEKTDKKDKKDNKEKKEKKAKDEGREWSMSETFEFRREGESAQDSESRCINKGWTPNPGV